MFIITCKGLKFKVLRNIIPQMWRYETKGFLEVSCSVLGNFKQCQK